MQAVFIERTGGTDVLTLSDVPQPEPGAGEVVIRVAAAAVNFIDTLVRAGALPPQVMPALPAAPGVECAGTVAAVGADVPGVKVGDQVVYFGGIAAGCYAEFVKAPADRVWALPANADLQAAAVLPVNYATAYHMLHGVAAVRPGQTVLIHAAAGGVGTALVQLAKRAGVTVIGLAGSPEKVQYALAQGADHAIDYRRENVAARVKAITGGKGVDASFNPIAARTLVDDAALLAPFGQIVVFGFLGGMPDVTVTEVLAAHFGKSIGVRVSDIYTLYTERPQHFSELMHKVIAEFAEGRITPRVFDALPLAQAARAHALLESGAVAGKLLLTA